MAAPKDILVVTSSTLYGIKIKRYLKPVSAHIVAGTNLFSDFMGGISDIFGGRSQSYQKQLASLYNEAIDRIKHSAYEIGANGVIGLSIDMDEISGKGKSMFMLTAIGTAVILDQDVLGKEQLQNREDFMENVGVERINTLKKKNLIVEKANNGKLELTDDIWDFITSTHVTEVFPFLIQRYRYGLVNETITTSGSDNSNFHKLFTDYIDSLPSDEKLVFLYNAIREETNGVLVLQLSKIVRDLNLYNFEKSIELLKSDEFVIQKRGLRLVTYDKLFYNKQDKEDLKSIITYVQDNFKERGTRTSKKQLLSKEKEVWVCECGKTNDIDEYCGGCEQDIYGFKEREINPIGALNHLTQKVELITEFIE